MPKITKRLVDALRRDPHGKDVFVWDAGDGALKGFGIRVKPSGAASYIVQYRNKEGRTRRLVIGKVGTLTPDEGRTLAGDALKAAAKGGRSFCRSPRGSWCNHDFRTVRFVRCRRQRPHQAIHFGDGPEPHRNSR
jgi:Arm DNA-binding domain